MTTLTGANPTPPTQAAAGERPIRVVVQQFALPKYRVPVFRELASRPGIDLTLVYSTYPGLPNVEPDGFKAEHTAFRRWAFRGQEFHWHPGQIGYATRRKADVLILSWSTRYVSLIPALLIARLRGVPVVLWGHGFSKKERRWAFVARKMVARLARAVLFYNHTAAERFIGTGFARKRVYVAINSLDQGPIQSARREWLDDPARLRAFQEEKGLTDRPCVIFVSRLDAGNRVPLLVEATDILRRTVPNVLVLIVGFGEEHEKIKVMVEQKQLGENVRMLGSIYNERELAAYFVSSKVFCYPRNVGLSLLHAFGYGLPVVTGDDMGSHNPEIEALRPGQNGLTYKDGDAASLASSLHKILSDDALRERLGREALRTVEERFSLTKMVDGFEAAIRYCVARS